MEKKKLFRLHKGGFKESIETSVPVEDYDEIKHLLYAVFYDMSWYTYDEKEPIVFSKKEIKDDRLPDEWGKIEYEVCLKTTDGDLCLCGYTNFAE